MLQFRLARLSWFLSAVMLFACAAQADSASKPMVTHNPDGTFTVQKEPRKGNSKDAKAKMGLVIPPQVVVPMIPATEKKQSPQQQQKIQ
jgi:hypothetical protein